MKEAAQSGAADPAAKAAVTPAPPVTPAPQPPKKADTPAPDQSGSGGTPVDAPGGSVAYGYERTNGERTIELYTFSPATGVWTTTGASYNSTA